MLLVYISIYLIMAISVYTDIKSMRIPYAVIVTASLISCGFITHEYINGSIVWREVAYSLLPGIALISMSFISRQSIGYGDGLMMMAVGPVLGIYQMIFGVCLAFFISAIFSLVMLVLRKADKKTCFPFMPFLAISLGVSQIAVF